MYAKKNIAIIGYSGHSYVLLDAAERMGVDIAFYCEREAAKNNYFNLHYLGDESMEGFNWDAIDQVVIGIGDNLIRQKISEIVVVRGKELLTIVHPSSSISSYVKYGYGNFFAANSTINAFATIGNACIINTGSVVEHQCVIHDAVHIGPGAVLAGNVTVGEHSFIGANTVVKQGITIGRNVIVGAGSVVVKNIPDNETWLGNPAKFYKK